MTDQILSLDEASVQTHKQPKCKTEDAALMVQNKLRVFTANGITALQIRGVDHYAQVNLNADNLEWLRDALNNGSAVS